jgi:predicted RNA-binding protein with PUA-like domain
MSHYWLLKTEPSTYSFDDLVRDKKATWDGVANPVALRNLGAMAKGDQAFVYHTGDQKAIVGIARIERAGYPDPKLSDPRMVVVDLTPVRPLRKPVTLAAVKADKRFADFALVRISRLSVMPVSAEQWEQLLAME